MSPETTKALNIPLEGPPGFKTRDHSHRQLDNVAGPHRCGQRSCRIRAARMCPSPHCSRRPSSCLTIFFIGFLTVAQPPLVFLGCHLVLAENRVASSTARPEPTLPTCPCPFVNLAAVWLVAERQFWKHATVY